MDTGHGENIGFKNIQVFVSPLAVMYGYGRTQFIQMTLCRTFLVATKIWELLG